MNNRLHYNSCYCNRDSDDYIVKQMALGAGETDTAHIFRPEILFVTAGTVDVSTRTGAGRRLGRGEFVFLPAGTRLECASAAASGAGAASAAGASGATGASGAAGASGASGGGGESSVMLVHVTGELPECPVFRIDGGAGAAVAGGATADGGSSGVAGGAMRGAGNKAHGGLYALRANSRIDGLVADLDTSLRDGFTCRHFLQGEANRLLFLIHAYYDEVERAEFFSHVLTPDVKFSEFVRANHMKYRTIDELSKAIGMNPQAFAIRFKKIFGTTPHKWMQQEKARRIYLDICRSELSLKEIAERYDFTLLPNFYRFCKQIFGDSPGRIRKGLHKSMV